MHYIVISLLQLIDLLSGPDVKKQPSSSKRPAPEAADELPQSSWKKPKKKPSSSLIKFTTEGCDPLVLPTPSNDHQVL